MPPCLPSGKGIDYPVGPGQAYTALDQVPWEGLKAGDTVRIFPSATPYAGKFLIAAQGTADAPVRICGVRAADDARPVIDGNGATTRAALASAYGSSTYASDIHQARSVIVIKPLATQGWTAYPQHVQIDGLKIQRAHPSYTFRDAAGATKSYLPFGACIWVERGHHITLADNEISDCQMAIFSKSTDDGEFAQTRNLRIAGNHMHGHGIAGSYTEHTTYTQSIGAVIEFNHYGPLRAGALGNSVKDRSAGLLVRYNRIEEGAHAIDLVEAEDFPVTALALPAYRTTHVIGNQIRKTGDTGSVIHYGGDHYGSSPGALWGEPIYRKGTLHLQHNTFQLGGKTAWLLQLSTTEETAEVHGNIVIYADSVTQRNLRMSQQVGTGWTSGGIVNLGINWVSSGWQDSDIWHPVPGQLNGTAALISGSSAPIDLATWIPLAGSAVIDAAAPWPLVLAGHEPVWQLDASGRAQPRSIVGSARDLGSVER